MKKILTVLIIAIAMVSCDCPYGWDEYDDSDETVEIHYYGDEFYADVLLGTWQCEELTVSGYEFKEIVFMSGNKADIVMCKKYDTDWYTYTYAYACYGRTLKFTRNGSTIEFTRGKYIFPQLELRDSFGTYKIKKVATR